MSGESAQNQSTRAQPPRVSNYPLVGSLPSLAKGGLDFITETQRRYGDIFNLDLGFAEVTILGHPRHAQHVLVDHVRNYSKTGPIWDWARTFLGNGLPVSEGEYWKRQRVLAQPAFHRQRLIAMTELMSDAIDEILTSWVEESRSGKPFDLGTAFNRITMSVLVRTLFGTGLAPGEGERVRDAFTYIMRYMGLGMITESLPAWVPLPGRARYRQEVQQLDEVVRKVIARGREGSEKDGAHLLSLLLNSVDAATGERMTDQQLRDEVVALFVAGFETSASVLGFTFNMLSHNPELAQRVRDEADSVLGQRKPGFADLHALSFSRNLLCEALRLFSPSYFLPRMAVNEDEIDGFRIPAGKQVAVATYLIHHHPDAWEDPLRFDPDRFTPKRSEGRHKQAWMPFGAGQRQCIGKEFAIMEAHLVLVRTIQRFVVTPVPGWKLEVQLAGNLHPKNGVWVYLKPREAAAQQQPKDSIAGAA